MLPPQCTFKIQETNHSARYDDTIKRNGKANKGRQRKGRKEGNGARKEAQRVYGRTVKAIHSHKTSSKP